MSYVDVYETMYSLLKNSINSIELLCTASLELEKAKLFQTSLKTLYDKKELFRHAA